MNKDNLPPLRMGGPAPAFRSDEADSDSNKSTDASGSDNDGKIELFAGLPGPENPELIFRRQNEAHDAPAEPAVELTDEQRKQLEKESEFQRKYDSIRNDVTKTDEDLQEFLNKEGIKPHPVAKKAGKYYIFPGIDGIPYRNRTGVPPNLKSDLPFRKQPQIVVDAKARVFKLYSSKDASSDDETDEYEAVLQKIASGSAAMSEEQKIIRDDGCVIVFIRWGEYYFEER